MKGKLFLAGMLAVVLAFGFAVIGCQPDSGDGTTVPEKLRGVWAKGTAAYITFSSATVSFGAGSTQSSVYTVTKVSDSSIFIKNDDKEQKFADYTMPNSNSLTLSGGEFDSVLAGTYTKDTE